MTDRAEPTDVTQMDTRVARVTTPPRKIAAYASSDGWAGHSTYPPAAVICCWSARDVATTPTNGRTTTAQHSSRTTPLTARITGCGGAIPLTMVTIGSRS